MIQVTIQTSSGEYKGFSFYGHSGFAEEGSDIICAAVSALVINTVNSLERFTSDQFDKEIDEDKPLISVRFTDRLSPEGKLLVDSMILGVKDVADSYGYVEMVYKEE